MNIDLMPTTNSRWDPDDTGRFGAFGGRFVPETLMAAVIELGEVYAQARSDRAFWEQLHQLLTTYVGRPSPLYYASRLSEQLGGAKIYLKREDLNHTGAHKINNTMGQLLLTRRMGKKRVIAETGAGQHGVATATAAASTPPVGATNNGRGQALAGLGLRRAAVTRRPDTGNGAKLARNGNLPNFSLVQVEFVGIEAHDFHGAIQGRRLPGSFLA